MTVQFKGHQQGCQGDVMFTRVDEVPEAVVKAELDKNRIVVAHSETGHDHAIMMDKYPADACVMYDNPENELESFLVVFGEDGVSLEHQRGFDPHETVHFDKGTYRINRQREHTPDGYRRVAD